MSIASNGAFLDVPFIPARCGGSKTVATASFSVVMKPIFTRARRVEPTPCGGGDVHHSCTFPGNHFPVFSTLVRTAKTSSIGRLITIELLIWDIEVLLKGRPWSPQGRW